MLEEDTFQVGSHGNEHSNHEGGRCGICMDVIIDRGVLDCCQHWFCFACIDNWSTITNLCPLCQGEFQLITCVPVYDTIGSNNVDEDSLSRDNDWFIEGKSSTLSFPSYYIDENAVICLDGDGCKIRNGSTLEGVPNFDTSIACDSCDLWYHAFCVGFDPEGTSEDTWLCPRCTVEVPQKSCANLIKSENNECGPESVTGEYLAEAAFSGKVSVSVADAGETAVVVSMVEGTQRSEEPNDYFLSTLEVDEDLGTEMFLPDATGPKYDSQVCERTNIQPVLGTQELELSLSHDTSLSLPSNSLGPSELKIGGADAKVNEQSCFDGVKSSLTNSFNELYGKKLSESESSIGLHLGLSVGSFLSVDDIKKNVIEDQIAINKNVTEDITMNKNVTEDRITMNKNVTEDQITLNKNVTEDQIAMNKNVTEGQIAMNKNVTEDPITMNRNVTEDPITMNKNLTEDQFTMNKYVTEDQFTRDVQQQNPSGESLPKADKIEAGAGEDASQVIGVKRKNTDCSDDSSLSGDKEEIKAKKVTVVSAKRTRAEGRTQMIPPKKKANASSSVDSQKCPISMVDPQDYKSKCHLDKEDIAYIMDIVKGTTCRPAKEFAHHNSADKSLKEKENVSGLRVKKIMKRAAEDKDSSELVQELRNEIREFVRNRSSKEIGENLFDPKLLAAFRAAIVGPKPEPVKKVSPSAVKVKKSMLEKGKVRENLTKKIYGNPNGRRRRAWDRDCEVEFWKYRCMRASKPEKIETLKSVLNLLRKNSEISDAEQVTGCQATNPILSRLYLADTSVFPRKDDIKPLSALKAPGNSDQSKEQAISIEKASKLSLDNCASKVNGKGKFPSKVSIPLLDEKGTKTSLSCSKSDAVSSKVQQNGRPKGPSVSSLDDSSVNSKSGTTVKSDNVKMDKRKWALEILSRKTASGGKSGMHEKQEDNAVLKGNYPLLAQLPIDMRPVLAPSRHNKIPISVRQTQLYRLTEQFLRKANLPVIYRTGETELAVADAINIEREVADRSNSKVVYLNLCSQEIMHRSNDKKSRAAESNSSSSSAVPVEEAIDKSEQAIDKPSDDHRIEEALRNAGLLSDSPPGSPHHSTEVQNKVGLSLMEMKEEEPDNVFEMDSQQEVDIYGDFDYDLEDEDYIGASAVKVFKVQPEEVASKMKVVFSTLNSEKSSNFVDLEDDGGWDVEKDSICLLKSHTDAGIRSSTAEKVTCNTSVPPVSLPCEEGEDLSLAECEELYGPEKELLVDKFPGESQKLYGLHDGEAPAESKCTGEASNAGTEENITVNTNSQNSSGIEKSPSHLQKGDKNLGKETTSSTGADKQCDSVNLVHKKVEAYVKEHIRPLCKSGVITAEKYRWAVAKATDKVMKYHSSAKNANFLIKEGEKVKKLAEQYVEAAQQK